MKSILHICAGWQKWNGAANVARMVMDEQRREGHEVSFATWAKVRVVSNAFGEEKEKVWEWCDVLVLPTLSDNFGLVIAEALERGKRVITTDGAPAWGDGNDYGGRLIYLKGYRDGSPEERIQLLKSAIEGLVVSASNGRNCKIVIDKYA